MHVIPAVDVRGGRTVRLRQGDYARETMYDAEPSELVRSHAGSGARRIHIVDLDAARGKPDADSRDAVRRAVEVAAEAGCEAQVGGGVRTAKDARNWLDAGAVRVVLGSVAVADPEVARRICEAHPGRVLLALDIRDGAVLTEGWTRSAAGDVGTLLAAWSEWRSDGVVYTNTARDGMLGGPDLDGLQRCRAAFGGPVTLSGGVRDVADVVAAAAAGADGVIAGRAVLEGKLDLRSAIESLAVRR